ncbi:gluconate 2-dehydrogenase subunit 3 family protein [Sphingomonas parva]|uniref:Gluconate 2-dehydrogenase subunit 3 family protein n=1 Tax=Sphingomonas parva TaxID=2555898 RepID=A0A4Y8ZNF0_9SPHN|nr:gluconate 2-dehydrogenase subunit 3 family protein [Sphingomonas parva]TFI56329.1 gluconate 2-dehydrogenase subunit 3 family protein [Sphingomonas parva]
MSGEEREEAPIATTAADGKGIRVDRRVTLSWLAGAMAAAAAPLRGAYAAPPAGPAATAQPGTATTPPDAPPAWPNAEVKAINASGYGTDPKMLEPTVPWPRTLGKEELRTVAAICDTILPAEGQWPAPSAIGIQDFVDEWISAPYPDQQADRVLVLSGLAWLEAAQKPRQAGTSFADLDEKKRAALLHAAAAADPKGRAFVDKMKFLTTGAYYTSEPGIGELGYIGNEPLEGDYPGPTKEALAHLDGVLRGMGLRRKG